MIREPAVAGQFYSARPEELRNTLTALIDKQETQLDAKAVICPHAGYLYSGGVAGAVYSAVQLPKRVIVLGPNHTGRGAPLSIYPDGEWRTPLGIVPLDSQVTEALLHACHELRADRAAHLSEHCVEVQIPFLQMLVPELSFTAICVGSVNYCHLEELGHALARVIQNTSEPVLMIASSDMNHYESAEIAEEKDRWAIDQISRLNPRGLYDTVLGRDISMCGFAPTVSVLIACRDLHASQVHLIRHTHSGEVSGDFDHVVGYAGLAIS